MDAGRESGGKLIRGAGGGQGGEEAVCGGEKWRRGSKFCACGEYERVHLEQGELS